VKTVSSLQDLSLLLRAISNPTRLAILRYLNGVKGSSYTRLALSAGFDPAEQSGTFTYHLHYLRKLGLLKLEGLTYTLTNLGERVSSFLDALTTEFVISFSEAKKGDRVKGGFKIKKLEETDLEQLTLTKYGILKEETDGVLHDYVESERIWVYGKDAPLGGEGDKNRTLIALDNKRILGAIYGCKSSTGPIPEGTVAYKKVEEGQVLLHTLTAEDERWMVPTAKIYDLWIDPMYHDKGVEKTLIEAFIKEAKDEGCREAWASEIRAVRKDLLKVLREEGFKKLDTYYDLYKKIT